MSRLQRDIDRLFDQLLGPSGRTGLGELIEGEMAFAPACDVEETDNQYLLTFDLPGLKKEDIRVELADRILRVSGERKEEREEKSKGSRQRERLYGAFQRVITLPSASDAAKVEASYQNGVLRIAIPKVESAKSQMIQITEGPAKKSEKGEKAA